MDEDREQLRSEIVSGIGTAAMRGMDVFAEDDIIDVTIEFTRATACLRDALRNQDLTNVQVAGYLGGLVWAALADD